jgi:hypothetical protein
MVALDRKLIDDELALVGQLQAPPNPPQCLRPPQPRKSLHQPQRHVQRRLGRHRRTSPMRHRLALVRRNLLPARPRPPTSSLAPSGKLELPSPDWFRPPHDSSSLLLELRCRNRKRADILSRSIRSIRSARPVRPVRATRERSTARPRCRTEASSCTGRQCPGSRWRATAHRSIGFGLTRHEYVHPSSIRPPTEACARLTAAIDGAAQPEGDDHPGDGQQGDAGQGHDTWWRWASRRWAFSPQSDSLARAKAGRLPCSEKPDSVSRWPAGNARRLHRRRGS